MSLRINRNALLYVVAFAGTADFGLDAALAVPPAPPQLQPAEVEHAQLIVVSPII
jgi:hypothetical protein